jgi:hypothetical protein
MGGNTDENKPTRLEDSLELSQKSLIILNMLYNIQGRQEINFVVGRWHGGSISTDQIFDSSLPADLKGHR